MLASAPALFDGGYAMSRQRHPSNMAADANELNPEIGKWPA
jgi:hypothetical protein